MIYLRLKACACGLVDTIIRTLLHRTSTFCAPSASTVYTLTLLQARFSRHFILHVGYNLLDASARAVSGEMKTQNSGTIQADLLRHVTFNCARLHFFARSYIFLLQHTKANACALCTRRIHSDIPFWIALVDVLKNRRTLLLVELGRECTRQPLIEHIFYRNLQL